MSAQPQAVQGNGNGTSRRDLQALTEAFRDYLVDPTTATSGIDNPVEVLLSRHFGSPASSLPTETHTYFRFLELCYQRALDEFLSEPGREYEMYGVRCPSVSEFHAGHLTYSRLLSKPTFAFVPPVFCPVDWVATPSAYEETEPCVRNGLILVRDAEGPVALWIRLAEHIMDEHIALEVMAPTVERAAAIIERLQEAAKRLSPFRGQMFELHMAGPFSGNVSSQVKYGPIITFLERPPQLERDQVILPEGLLDQIERHSLGAIAAKPALKASGRHLRRGILLHGRPGTGKTHTIKYLVNHMPGATIAVMTGARMVNDLRALRDVMDVIVPGVIILDDVDLIATSRALGGSRWALFELLEILDGINEDSDLLYIMTTNRPNEIEPAVATRPGRIDQAIEVPLPDATCRRRLFELYTRGVTLEPDEAELARFLERTEGVTASLIREVVRRAALASLEEDASQASVAITWKHLSEALDELLDPDSPLTPLLLGAEPRHALPVADVQA